MDPGSGNRQAERVARRVGQRPPGVQLVRWLPETTLKLPGPGSDTSDSRGLRIGLDLAVLPPAVLVPLEPERAWPQAVDGRPGESGTRECSIPAATIRNRRWPGGRAGPRFRAVCRGAELVHGGSARNAAAGRGGCVHPVQRVRVAAHLVRCQRAADDQVPVPVELPAFRGRDRPCVLNASHCARQPDTFRPGQGSCPCGWHACDDGAAMSWSGPPAVTSA